MYRMENIMPAKAPPVGEVLAARLQALGEQIRAHREQQKVSATLERLGSFLFIENLMILE